MHSKESEKIRHELEQGVTRALAPVGWRAKLRAWLRHFYTRENGWSVCVINTPTGKEGYMITVKNEMSAEDVEKLKRVWETLWKGREKNGK